MSLPPPPADFSVAVDPYGVLPMLFEAMLLTLRQRDGCRRRFYATMLFAIDYAIHA